MRAMPAFGRLRRTAAQMMPPLHTMRTRADSCKRLGSKSSCDAMALPVGNHLLVRDIVHLPRLVDRRALVIRQLVHADPARLDRTGVFRKLVLVFLRPSLDPLQDFLECCHHHLHSIPSIGERLTCGAATSNLMP